MNSGNRNVLLTRCSTPIRPIPQGPILNSPSRACGFKRQMFWRVEAGISSVSVASDHDCPERKEDGDTDHTRRWSIHSGRSRYPTPGSVSKYFGLVASASSFRRSCVMYTRT